MLHCFSPRGQSEVLARPSMTSAGSKHHPPDCWRKQGKTRGAGHKQRGEGVGISPSLSPFAPLLHCSRALGHLSEGKGQNELNQTTGSLWEEVSHQPALHNGYESAQAAQLFPTVPHLVRRKGTRPLWGIPLGVTKLILHLHTPPPKGLWRSYPQCGLARI